MEKSEKWSLGIALSIVALLFGVGLFWNRFNAEAVFNIPEPEVVEPNAFNYYVKAGQALAALSATTPGADAVDRITDEKFDRKWTPQQIAKRYPTPPKVAWVKKCAPVLQTFRKGFSYHYQEPPQRLTELPRPYFLEFRKLARLLIVEGHTRSEQGDWTGACRSILDVMRLSHDLPRGGPWLAAQEGCRFNFMSRRELRTIVPHLDAPAARLAATQIEKLESNRYPLAKTLEEEKWVIQVRLRDIMSRPDWRTALIGRSPDSSADQSSRVEQMRYYSKYTIAENHAQYMDAVIAAVQKPYTRRPAPTLPADPFNRALMDPKHATFMAARDEAGNCMSMLQLALRAFELEHRRLPLSLKELVPSYLKKIPTDPFGGGEALRYRRADNTYLLYSIGPDGKDDGGKAINSTTNKGVNFHAEPNRYQILAESIGDFVAGINR